MSQVISIELVDMSGFIRTITPESKGWEGSLWFALRGAGGNNFGVVTKLTFALEDAPPKSVYFELYHNTAEDCGHALLTFQKLGSLPATDPNSLSTLLSGELDGIGTWPAFCRLRGIYMGSLNDFNKSLSTYTSRLADNDVYYDPLISFVNAHDNYLGAIGDMMAEYGGVDGTEFHVRSYGQSLADDGVYSLTLDSAKAFMHTVAEIQPSNGSFTIQPQFCLSGPASATSRPPRYSNMAFSHTNNIFVSQTLTMPLPDVGTSGYLDGVGRSKYILNAMKVAAGGSSKQWYGYQNYMDPYIKDFGRAYYGDNLESLKEIKELADPYNILDFPMGLAHA